MHSTIYFSDPTVLSDIDPPILSYPENQSCTDSTKLSCIDPIEFSCMEPNVFSCTDTTELYFNDKTDHFCALTTVLSYTNLMNIPGVYISQNSPPRGGKDFYSLQS